MCGFDVQVHLHCGHVTFVARRCNANPHATKIAGIVIVADEDIPKCPNHRLPKVHSYLTCCKLCREKNHEVRTTTIGTEQLYAHLSTQACGDHISPETVFKTCERFTMRNEMSTVMQQIGVHTASDQNSAAQMPYSSQHNGYYTPAYLHFACGHGIDYVMPKATFKTTRSASGEEISEHMFSCGCYAGNVPKIPINAMIMAADVMIRNAVNPVWEVAGPCWKHCSHRRIIGTWSPRGYHLWGKPVGGTSFDQHAAVNNANDPYLPGNSFTSEAQKVEHFLEHCKEWEDFEQWKISAQSGDNEVNSMRLNASSRF
ncbi:hypothetical protein UCRPC4_g00266 [Phaeomoniella chlamydospora]|uniref:Uncharacterized protein n=1 Tax=Phaeomoniella chlamydospora TaxID=158046 RepID=A0A0G2F2Q5_PHACM|nr:hypothetical protein UCRPC4_g00266 [Phaeomoniella chlamydospora]